MKGSGKSKMTGWVALPALITAVAALITAGSKFVEVWNNTSASTDSQSETSESSERDAPSLNSQISVELKTVGRDVVLVDTTGNLELPEVENNLDVSYTCQNVEDGSFKTIAKTSQSEVTLINWSKYIGTGFSPSDRCETVSERFEAANRLGRLNFLTTGRMNGENVICVSAQDGDCDRSLSDNGLLYTITTGTPPSDALLNLLDLGLGKDVPPINESTGDRMYVNISQLVEQSEDTILQKEGDSKDEILDESSAPLDESECFLGCDN